MNPGLLDDLRSLLAWWDSDVTIVDLLAEVDRLTERCAAMEVEVRKAYAKYGYSEAHLQSILARTRGEV